MKTHPENSSSAMEALSSNNQILIMALEPVGHDTPAIDMLSVRPEGFKMDPVTNKSSGNKQLAAQFTLGQQFIIPDFNTNKKAGKDLQFVGRVEKGGKTTGDLFGRAAIFVKKWKIDGGPTARGWVWMSLLKEEQGIYGDWAVKNISFDEECVLGAVGGSEASLWDVATNYAACLETRKEREEAAELLRKEEEAKLQEKLKAISPLCEMAISNYSVAAPILGDLLPEAARVGLLLKQDKATEAVDAYESIKPMLEGMEVPKVKKAKKEPSKSLPKAFTDLPKTSKNKAKKKYDFSAGFKKILRMESDSNNA